MEEIIYKGEHLIPGILGKSLVFLAFSAALLSALAYFFASRENQKGNTAAGWNNLGKAAFLMHVFAIAGIVSTLFYMILNHQFEYHYVWQHSSKALPFRYMFSCFWEGQEGSFLLWMSWHALLGLIILRKGGTWKAPVISVLSLVQLFLASMLLGVYIFGYKLGSNPFILLRHHPDMANLPFVSNPDYLAFLDGRGLNPLLQNYWMTIHPPTLFLGFAATAIPFSYAIAGLWTGRYGEWIKPALPWTIFGVLVLGTGILMGGAWAYEALSFGGFWAWDPVENASLVPWLTLVGALHLMMVYRAKKRSLFATTVFVCLTFFLILYSSFLTRSGILGDASVHAFTDLGMFWHLVSLMLFFPILSIVLLVARYRHLRDTEKEEHLWSREFWLFIGSLILFIAAFQIIFTTSTPVINQVFGTDKAPPADPIEHYNSWQIAFAIIITLLAGGAQFLKYKQTKPSEWIRKIAPSFLVAVTGGVAAGWALQFKHPQYYILLCTSFFAVFANADYAVRILKGKISHAGASLSHLGFGLILTGALIANANQKIISQNSSAYDLDQIAKDLPNRENIMLMQGDTLRMGDYYVTYTGKRKEGVNIYYDIQYLTKDANGNFRKAFSLEPLIQMNQQMGNVAEPDTRHFLTRDIYTHVQYADLSAFTEKKDPFENAKTDTLTYGDTLFARQCMIILDTVSRNLDRKALRLAEHEVGAAIHFTALDVQGKRHPVAPVFLISGDHFRFIQDSVPDLGIRLMVTGIIPETERFVVVLTEEEKKNPEFIIMKAIEFPMINLLWTGCIVLIIGTSLSIRKRLQMA